MHDPTNLGCGTEGVHGALRPPAPAHEGPRPGAGWAHNGPRLRAPRAHGALRLLAAAVGLGLLLATAGACSADAPRQQDDGASEGAAEPGFRILQREMLDDVEEAYLSYPSGDLTVTGRLYVNPFSARDVEPCIVFNHGGVGGISEAVRAKCRWLAKQGYVVFAPSYRGEDDSEGEVEVADGEVDDVVAALQLLEHHPGILPGRFALLGTSHGALVSVKAAARPEVRGLLRAVVAAYGVMDIYSWYQYLVDNDFDVHDSLSLKVYGEGPDDKPEAFAARHALALIDRLPRDLPLFLVQGGRDRIVPQEQALTMFHALREAGRSGDLCRVYPTGGHGFLFWDDPELHSPEELHDAERAWIEILQFLQRELVDDGEESSSG